MRSRRARRVAFAVLYAVGLLAFLEVASRWILGSKERVARLGSPVDDPSWRRAWVLRREPGRPLRFGFDVPHPTRGWTLRPSLRAERTPEGWAVSSTARGARGRIEPAVPKPAGTVRIVALGDSFTFGEGVEDDQTFPHHLGGLLPGVDVVNLGVHGYGHDQMLVTLREEGPAYEPDLVVLGYVTDDALRNVLAFRDFAKPRFELVDGQLERRGTPVPSPDAVLRSEARRSRLVDVLTMLSQRLSYRLGPRRREMERVTLAILAELAATSSRLGASFAIVDLPVWRELDIPDPRPTERERTVESFCAARQIPYLRLRPLLLAERRRGVGMSTSAHWGPGEHRLAASAIGDFVRSRRLLVSPRSAP